MKYAWIDAQTYRLALAEMCDTLEVSVSGYRAWKRGGTPDRKRLTAGQTLAMICAIHAEVKGAYGSPRRCVNCASGAIRRAKGVLSD